MQDRLRCRPRLFSSKSPSFTFCLSTPFAIPRVDPVGLLCGTFHRSLAVRLQSHPPTRPTAGLRRLRPQSVPPSCTGSTQVSARICHHGACAGTFDDLANLDLHNNPFQLPPPTSPLRLYPINFVHNGFRPFINDKSKHIEIATAHHGPFYSHVPFTYPRTPVPVIVATARVPIGTH